MNTNEHEEQGERRFRYSGCLEAGGGRRWPNGPLSTPFHKYDHVCCVAFRFWLGATREHPPSRPVGMTEEQQRQNRKATQPCGRRFFSAQTSLLAPYPDVSGKGMRVARASSGPKLPRRQRGRIYETGY